jgi:hypothetical protein
MPFSYINASKTPFLPIKIPFFTYKTQIYRCQSLWRKSFTNVCPASGSGNARVYNVQWQWLWQ